MDNIKKSFKELKWYEYLMGAVMISIAARAMVLGFMQGSADGNPAWLTVINFISAVCGVICIFFTAKANISNFAFPCFSRYTFHLSDLPVPVPVWHNLKTHLLPESVLYLC